MVEHPAQDFPHPDRLLGADPSVRELARELYSQVAQLPLVSPHGHVDATVLEKDEMFPDPAALLVTPDHYITRLLHAQGVPLENLGVPARGPAGAAPATRPAPRDIWRLLCRYWPVFRGTSMRLWLEHELADLFDITGPLTEETSDQTFDQVTEHLQRPEMRPRALFQRFGLEVLATTDSPLDDLDAHQALDADPAWHGKVVPTFRPDQLVEVTDPGRWNQLLEQLHRVSGIDTGSYRGYIEALEARRAAFKALGATATDHGHFSIEPTDLSEHEASRLYDRLRLGPHQPGDAAVFLSHMLMEMARMSAEDGLVMQLHPGVWRNHDSYAFARFGPDIGADFPVATSFTASLHNLLDRFGSHPGFRAVAFTVDETVYSRELAPMASYYPGLWLGAPWWFLDAPDSMARFWSGVVETAGFSKLAGFVDDTRAYCSIPARHDVARRAYSTFLARLVLEHRLSKADAAEVAADFAYRSPKIAFRFA
ncbi:MAG: glucuronate isomerase [Acidimicrobiales bacterium]